MNVLTINFNHDGAAAIFRSGELAGYVNTERLSRRKKHPGVRDSDICHALAQANLAIEDLDLVLLLNLNTMDSPEVALLHGSDLKDTWPDFWINNSFTRIRLLGHTCPCEVSRLHHLFHATLAFFFSPFDSGASFACDPAGAHVFFFADGHVVPSHSTREVRAAGVYDRVSAALLGTALVGAGKLMALAAYGAQDPRPMDYSRLLPLSREAAYEALAEHTKDDPVIVWENGQALNASLAYHAQAFLEYNLSRLLSEIYDRCTELGLEPNLCLSGGTALNSTANQRCFAASPFRRLYIHPACGDDGTAIGAGMAHWHLYLNQPRRPRSNREAMYGCRTYDREIPAAIDRHRRDLQVRETADEVRETAGMIADGQVVGWYQGASEIGPRALGNRSILADPRRATMRDYLNRTIKHREGFRPFAPSILNEHADAWFGIGESPFMLRVAPVLGRNVPAVTHVDGTARPQTVTREDNPRFHDLITGFHAATHVPMILNTSFNGDGEPIVETPDDAIRCMLATKLDALVLPGFILRPNGHSA